MSRALRAVEPAESERFSVTFVPPSVQSIQALTELSGLSKTDVINRAVQIYAFLAGEMADGRQVLLRNEDGSLERVHIV
ncbi:MULTISPECIES: hypothetical protein [unclassified Streptomyces]|uniref:hypothetical protein n=1 Tax=unclassified Streptomyces TaxID=2593676 RepID=UPI001660E689|nr:MULTISPECIES: hypothetical protein [unclassified Streptomyces]MBD0707111.1 hypothetical protein [Streptomyces sp. CBMA291]MBD0713599.1 hypothetical protein [Streptomyces sp. CBMA370]